MNSGVSVIVCCFNSEQRLPTTIDFLSKQKSSIPWEVVLVDNNSSDSTKKVAMDEWNKTGSLTPFKIIDQPISGLAAAREKGIETAAFDFLLFCDDDNWLSANYVETVYKLFLGNSEIGVIGGCGAPVTEVEPPLWFEQFIHGYAAYQQAEQSSYVGAVFGAGIAFRKNVYTQIRKKYQPILIGRKGKALSAGDDSEMCYLYRLSNYKIWYDSRLKFQHFIPSNRLTWEYLKKLHIGFAKSNIILNLYGLALVDKNKKRLPTFYWLKNGFYYLAIYFKYWAKYFSIYTKGNGSMEEVLHKGWKVIGLEYFKLNFRLQKFYRNIVSLKTALANSIKI